MLLLSQPCLLLQMQKSVIPLLQLLMVARRRIQHVRLGSVHWHLQPRLQPVQVRTRILIIPLLRIRLDLLRSQETKRRSSEFSL